MSIFQACDRLFLRLPEPIYLRTTLAGLVLGSIAVMLPLTRYFSNEQLNEIISNNFPAVFLLTIGMFFSWQRKSISLALMLLPPSSP